jgi:hypothetical protein
MKQRRRADRRSSSRSAEPALPAMIATAARLGAASLAAAATIGHRLPVIQQAFVDPGAADHAELWRMSYEKLDVAGESARLLMRSWLPMQRELFAATMEQSWSAFALARELATARNPGDASGILQRWLRISGGRAIRTTGVLAGLALGGYERASRPLERRVLGNARRLRARSKS